MNSRTQKILPLFVVAAGLLIAYIINLSWLPDTKAYNYLIYTLLAIGLYGSVYSIELSYLKENKNIVINAVTIGVILKTIIISSILYFFIRKEIAFILGIAVAQIDPLAVANLLQDKMNLSQRGKTILAAWSSFDDPMTIILSLYIFSFTYSQNSLGSELYLFAIDFSVNILFCLMTYLIHRALKKCSKSDYLLFIICLIVAVYFKLMLGFAVIALFLRPNFSEILSRLITISFLIAALLLGFTLVNGISLSSGLLLGIAAFGSQIIAALLLARKLTPHEKIKLAFAQQNGITAIILALVFEAMIPGVVAVVAPAILFINLLHWFSNLIIDRFYVLDIKSDSHL